MFLQPIPKLKEISTKKPCKKWLVCSWNMSSLGMEHQSYYFRTGVPNFLSALVQEVCKLVGTTKLNTSGYHPQCDGLVEKFNGTLINIMVHFPSQVTGKAWKFSRPFFGPYKVLSLMPTNAEVQLLNAPQDQPIFVSLSRVRPCYEEMSDEIWAGHSNCTLERRLNHPRDGTP